MSTAPKILFWVQHLLGIGHLKRAATLTRAFRRGGFDVVLVSGGEEVPGLDVADARLVQLAPVRAADKYFKVLVDADGNEIDDAFRAARRAALLDVWRRERPDVLITELYPFGRRQLRFELEPLLEEVKTQSPPPLVVASVRDILVEPPKPERVAEMLARVRASFDKVMIHGDPSLIAFDETFAHAADIADRVAYTGYVVDTPPARNGRGGDRPGAEEVIVSAGGGAVSEELFRAAMAARPNTRLAELPWRILAGHALPEATFAAVAADAPAGVVVERARADFTTLMANCALSISQGGYNTVMEMITAGTRGVIVPYAGGLETEQTLRARLLEDRSGIRAIAEDALSADALGAAVDAALDAPPPDSRGLDTGGAEKSAALLRDWLAAHRRRAA